MSDSESDLNPLDAAIEAFLACRRLGERVSVEEFIERHPALSDDLRAILPALELIEVLKSDGVGPDPPPASKTRDVGTTVGTPNPDRGRTTHPDPALHESGPRAGGSPDTVTYGATPGAGDASDCKVLASVGRYQFIQRLGRGSFGTVFLARDTDLDRLVAVKLAREDRVSRPEDVESYLNEARALAAVDHPHVLPVHDFGREGTKTCYVVTKYVEGGDLSRLIGESLPSQKESARLIARLADGLGQAHRRGLVHRDIKPANILIAADGHPYLADFGLAIRESDDGHLPSIAGTPEYMSPEQARGEGHRIDPRSDIFSLGIVFYRLLTGRRPYHSSSVHELLREVIRCDILSPIEVNPDIAPGLDRICMKMIQKQATNRYQTAADVVEELGRWEEDGGVKLPSEAPTPRGLRAFGPRDSDAFLGLLPGPRDRAGLPESVAFWKQRIESTDEGAFAVGLLLGSSGSGKSSMISAGLVPKLGRHVVAIVLDCARGMVGDRLLASLRGACPGIDDGLDLSESLAAVRRMGHRSIRRKTLLVLDQFEHQLAGAPDLDLLGPLRQCDGVHLQALLVVRDDFAMAAARFFERLEIPIAQGDNFATIGRFSPDHARHVLSAFGRAYGRLPSHLSTDQEAFLDLAIAELADSGDVAPIRLAVFAETIRDRPWTPGSFRSGGGVEGVGVAFLDGLFASPASNPRLRAMAGPARAFLKALLPPPGSTIRGGSRSIADLRKAVEPDVDDRSFEELRTILDTESRLIVTIDEGDAPHHQLTHDYLVPSLRTWLTLKQRETARGRDELRLAERASGWSLDPSRRQLPGLVEALSIWFRTRRDLWTVLERRLMRAAGRHHALRMAVAGGTLGVVIGLGFAGWVAAENRRRDVEARGLVARLLDSEPSRVPGILAEIRNHERRTGPLLERSFRDGEITGRGRRRSALGMLPTRPELAGFLVAEAGRPDLDLDEGLLIRSALATIPDRVRHRLRDAVGRVGDDPRERFRVTMALAAVDPSSEVWTTHSRFVVDQMVSRLAAHPAEYGTLLDAFWPVRASLAGPMLDAYRSATGVDRSIAFNLLTRYAADDDGLLVALLEEAEPSKVGVLAPMIRRLGQGAVDRLEATLAERAKGRWADTGLPGEIAAPPASASAAIERAGGWVDGRFAIAQAVPIGDFVALAESLRPSGYRPTRLRPFADAQGTNVSAVWTRDGRGWRVAVGLDSGGLARRMVAEGRDGFEPVDVACYSAAAVPVRFAAVWVQSSPGQPERRSTFGLDDEAFAKTVEQVEAQGFAQLTHHVHDAGPRRVHSAVWSRTGPSWADPVSRYDGSAGFYDGDLFLGNVEIDVSLGATDQPPDLARQAEQIFREIEAPLRKNPDDPNLRFRRGYAHYLLGRDDRALADWDALIATFPAYGWMWKLPRTVLHARRGNLDQARADLRDFLRQSKDAGKNAAIRAFVRAAEGDVAGAVDDLSREADDHPADPAFLLEAASAMARISELAAGRGLAEAGTCRDRAIALLDRSVRAGLKITPDVRDNHGFGLIGRDPRFLAIVGRGRLEDRYTAIWRPEPGVESTEVHGLSIDEHLARCRQLAAEGYRPSAIAAFRPSSDRPVVAASVWHRPRPEEPDHQRLADRQANAALALILLGKGDAAWPLLRHRADPSLATAILHRAASSGIKPATLADRFRVEPDADARRCLILALGLYPERRIAPDLVRSLVDSLSRVVRTEPDPGVRSAIEWALRRWDPATWSKHAAALANTPPRPGSGWYVDKGGDTYAIVKASTFEMGSRPEERGRSKTLATNEQLHRVEIPRRFAIAIKEVTAGQFARFLDENPALKPHYHAPKALDSAPEMPAKNVPLLLAIGYCWWLTGREGIPVDQQCYEAPDFGSDTPLTLRQGYLARTGYRLPTEAEWEYAARSGTTTSRPYGTSDALLPEYAWFSGNTADPAHSFGEVRGVGRLSPNRLGCFDVLGNVAEWTLDRFDAYPPADPHGPAVDREALGPIRESETLVARGGSFGRAGFESRSAARFPVRVSFTSPEVGFRVARTLPDD